ncbi:hypothetical protein PCASD_18064 [Puccinia coronata f. sp. avenae]|uniref:CxC1-like cysteine cluster associated with KDZ transposases domain-containing protein n=1 Tax=Puccinia coronata f. sp. avenae TaxID=200324 RepID=A0A2N5U0H9_9BASI|nr:hypothetical protein PCASD_18064 [Puccinia coronata f. sp. avenae]
MQQHIDELEVIHKISKSKKGADKCADSHKAADNTRNETTWKGCDDTGLMGSCCRHDSVISLMNIFESGENRALALSILKQILDNVNQTRPVGVLYDIGCSLNKFIKLRHIFPEHEGRLFFGTSVFHAFVHEWPCQLEYNPRYNDGWGLSDGESMEQLWSALSPQVSPLRYATRNNRLSALAHCSSWLRQKFLNALKKRDTAKNDLKILFEKENPYEEANVKYLAQFLRSQWTKQAECKSQHAEDNETRMKQLAEFFRNEEVLNKAKKDIFGEQGRLSSSVDDWERVLTLFESHEAKQQELAKSLGRNYNELLSATSDEEKKLTLLWEAKSKLFLQAVELQGERYPIMGSRTVGTKIQQRILKEIKRRKNPVEKAIKNFNTRRSDYLLAYEPTRAQRRDNVELTYKDFLKMDLNDPFWNDNFFFHSRDPWAIDSLVRHGIQAMLMLDRVQEEVQLLTHNLDRAMSWAHKLRMDLERSIRQLDAWVASPNTIDLSNPENWITMVSIALPMPSKLQVLRSELHLCLKDHCWLIKIWMCDIDWLWERTQNRHTKSEHPWFDCMADLREQHHEDALRSINNAMELLDFDNNPPDEVAGVRDKANNNDELDDGDSE